MYSSLSAAADPFGIHADPRSFTLKALENKAEGRDSAPRNRGRPTFVYAEGVRATCCGDCARTPSRCQFAGHGFGCAIAIRGDLGRADPSCPPVPERESLDASAVWRWATAG